jgi:hypothetical protein
MPASMASEEEGGKQEAGGGGGGGGTFGMLNNLKGGKIEDLFQVIVFLMCSLTDRRIVPDECVLIVIYICRYAPVMYVPIYTDIPNACVPFVFLFLVCFSYVPNVFLMCF